MEPLTMIALASAGMNSGGSMLNNFLQRRAERENIAAQNKYNLELAKYNQDRNIELWKMQNAYNAPAMQMQRFKDAGLNPNMIYNRSNEGGNITPSTASPSSQSVSPMQFPIPNIMDILSQSQNYALRQSQIKNTDSVTKLNEVKTAHEFLKQTSTITSTEKRMLEKQLFEELMPTNIAKAQYQVQNLQQTYDMNKLKMANIQVDTLSKQQKIEYQKIQNQIAAIEYEMQQKRGKEFQEMGIEKNDPILMKLLFRVSNDIASFLQTIK